ncbi:MAG: hypothetical protein ACTSSM_15630 [Promethearchaeota archaeon]
MNDKITNVEYFDFVEDLDNNLDLEFNVPDKVEVNSKTSIRIHFKARKDYPTKTRFRFIIPYGWLKINIEDRSCTIKSSVKGRIRLTNSQLMIEYIIRENLKPGDYIEFEYNIKNELDTAGDIDYFDKVYCAMDIKFPNESKYIRVGKKEISMVSKPATFLLIKIPSVYLKKPVDIEIVALDEFGNRDYNFNESVNLSGDECLIYPKTAVLKKGYCKLENCLAFKEPKGEETPIKKLLYYNTSFSAYPVYPELKERIGKIKAHFKDIHGTSNPIVWDEDISKQLYWGDTHVHTREFSDGIGTAKDAYHYAKNVSLLDFFAFGDHLNQRSNEFMEGRKNILYPYTRETWNTLVNYCNEWTDESFVAIPAYEWSGRNFYVLMATGEPSPYEAISDKVILFPLETAKDAPLVDYASKEGCYQHQLYEALRNINCAIISHRGSVIWALNNGFKLGFIGSGDDHYTHPGCTVGQEKMKNIVEILRYRPGLAAIFSEKLDSKHLIKNLNERNCYATTGERMWIKIKINDALMGQEITVNAPPIIIVTVCGIKKLESVELIKNGITIAIRVPLDDRIKFAHKDLELKNNEEAYYYVRATQFNGERGWSSPIWVRAKYV